MTNFMKRIKRVMSGALVAIMLVTTGTGCGNYNELGELTGVNDAVENHDHHPIQNNQVSDLPNNGTDETNVGNTGNAENLGNANQEINSESDKGSSTIEFLASKEASMKIEQLSAELNEANEENAELLAYVERLMAENEALVAEKAAVEAELKEERNPFFYDEDGKLACDLEYAMEQVREQDANGDWYYLIAPGAKLEVYDTRTATNARPEYLDNSMEVASNPVNKYQIIGETLDGTKGIYSIGYGGVSYVSKATVNGYPLRETTKLAWGGDFAEVFYNSFVYVEDANTEYGYAVYLAGDYVAPAPVVKPKPEPVIQYVDREIIKEVEVVKTEEICFICGKDKASCPGHKETEEICFTCGKDKVNCPGHKETEKICFTCGKDKESCPGHKETEEICFTCGKDKASCPGHKETEEICFTCGKDKANCPGHKETVYKTKYKTIYQDRYIYVDDDDPDNNPPRDDDDDFVDEGPADMPPSDTKVPENNDARDDDDDFVDEGPADMSPSNEKVPENNDARDDDDQFVDEGPADMTPTEDVTTPANNNNRTDDSTFAEGPADMTPGNTASSNTAAPENTQVRVDSNEFASNEGPRDMAGPADMSSDNSVAQNSAPVDDTVFA